MSGGNSEDNPFIPKDSPKPYSAKLNLIANTQLAGALILCGAIAFFYSQSNPNWQHDPAALTVLGILAVSGVVVHLILRAVLATAYERQLQEPAAEASSLSHRHEAAESVQDSSLSSVPENNAEKLKIVRKKQPLAVSATLLMIASSLLLGAGTVLSSPFHFYECFIAGTLLGLPVGYGVMRLFMSRNPVWPFPAAAQQDPSNPVLKPGSLHLQRGIFLIVLAVLFAGLGIGLNQWLDKSAPRQQTFNVTGRYTRTHKRSTSHYLEITANIPSPVPFLDFGGIEGVHVTQSEYASAIPGQTQITINIYPGLFGLPWYQETHVFKNPPVAADQPAQTKTPPANAPLLNEACNWRSDKFNMRRAIENIPPDNYRRDYWPNGQLRASEPLVGQQVHGMAHYTFANGRVYGDIPWKHGQKHGVFTLFREDGSREQTLSYKDGHLFGISEWYRQDGTISQTWLYLSERQYYPVSVCAPYLPH